MEMKGLVLQEPLEAPCIVGIETPYVSSPYAPRLVLMIT